MDYSKISLAAVLALGGTMASAQEIATWAGDRKAAVSFTFDDGAPSHVSDGGPLFDKYGYKATFNLVVNWSPDWNGFQKLADSGHEIASHSNSHGNNMSGEEASSKNTISGKIKQKYGCITVAYPNCNVPNQQAVNQNYIAGRICNGSWQSVPDIMGKDGPSDWTKVPALMTGTENGIQGTNGFTGKMQDAVKQGGWVMFLTHGFQGKNNGSATYSPTNINDIEGALKWGNEHDGDVWIAPFRNVAMYVKERKAAKVNKKSGDASSIVFEVTHSIKDNISDYDYPLTIKVKNENNWTKVKATQDGADIEATIKDGNIYVDAVPNKGDVKLVNGDAPAPASSSSEAEKPSSSSVAPSSSSVTPESSSSVDALPTELAFESNSSFAYVDQNGVITVGNAQGRAITVFNSLGHVVRTTKGLGSEQKVFSGAQGMYIVRIGNKVWKLNIK